MPSFPAKETSFSLILIAWGALAAIVAAVPCTGTSGVLVVLKVAVLSIGHLQVIKQRHLNICRQKATLVVWIAVMHVFCFAVVVVVVTAVVVEAPCFGRLDYPAGLEDLVQFPDLDW